MFQVQVVVTNVRGASVTGYLTPKPVQNLDEAKAIRDEAQNTLADGRSMVLFNTPMTFMNGFKTNGPTETLVMPDVAAQSIFTFNILDSE